MQNFAMFGLYFYLARVQAKPNHQAYIFVYLNAKVTRFTVQNTLKFLFIGSVKSGAS